MAVVDADIHALNEFPWKRLKQIVVSIVVGSEYIDISIKVVAFKPEDSKNGINLYT